MICCGHSQNNAVQHMAFSPNDAILVRLGALSHCYQMHAQHPRSMQD